MRVRDSGREGESGGVALTDSMVYFNEHAMGRSSELSLQLDEFRRTSEPKARSRDSYACVPTLCTVRHAITITHRKLPGVRWLEYCEVVPGTDYCQWGCLCLSVLLSLCPCAVLSVL